MVRSNYPHGGCNTFGLIAATLAALGLSIYSIGSCNFVAITFDSKWSFDQMFNVHQDQDDFPDIFIQKFTVAAGLFGWLEPIDTDYYTRGHCTGYSETMRENIADGLFEASRVIAVLVVIHGLALFIWTLLMSCIPLNMFQLWMQRIMFLVLTILMSSLYLIKKSELCHGVGMHSECKLGEGGIIGIAGSIMWFVAFLSHAVFMKQYSVDDHQSKPSSLTAVDREQITAKWERRKRRDDQKQREYEARRNKSDLEDHFEEDRTESEGSNTASVDDLNDTFETADTCEVSLEIHSDNIQNGLLGWSSDEEILNVVSDHEDQSWQDPPEGRSRCNRQDYINRRLQAINRLAEM